jgi:hypothetical protein
MPKGDRAMTKLDLRTFGFEREVEVYGTIEASWVGGNRVLFLFGENHRDREMKRLNVLNACTLVDARVVGCVGTEIPLDDLGQLTAEQIQHRSEELFREHQTDDAVIAYLSRHQPWWYGILQFGNTLKVLRPSLEVRCVEDPGIREQMKSIAERYEIWDLCGGEHPFPGHTNMEDHPINADREAAMIRHMITLWDGKEREAPAAILNTGVAHSRRLCQRVQEMGISYIYISIQQSELSFGSG